MRFKFLIIPQVLIFQAAVAQNPASSSTLSQGSSTTLASAAPSTTANPPEMTASPVEPESNQIAIIDYKSVYEANTLEEEVKMAAERFDLTKAQQDVWTVAATDRRAVEKQTREKLDSKASSFEKEGMYKGLRTAQNNFYEIIIGHLSPAQKQALERDRLINQEKQRRLAQLPPPPPPPAATVTPVDSSAVKASGKNKSAGKKSRRKKKAAG